ncbi:MAG TPA: trypsin-like serine protease [Bacteroidia bacterium]|jgi:hypothetical protein
MSITAVILLESLVVRHDVPEEKFISLAKEYPEICHFSNGEGVYIGDGWIMTAGHIGKDLLADQLNGRPTTVTCNGNAYQFGLVIVHPAFSDLDKGLSNDVSLVRIQGDNPVLSGLELYSGGDEKGKEIVIVGSGDVGNGQTGPQKWDKITRAATYKVDSTDAQWLSFVFDAPGTANVTDMEGVSGPGDSGGPAIINKDGKRYLAGISSHQKGQDKFGKGRYGVREFYTRISSCKDWIDVMRYGGSDIAIKDSKISGSIHDALLDEYVGDFGFRKILCKDHKLFFQRGNEPLIAMERTGEDLFLWDDQSTKIQFFRDSGGAIAGFKILRKNGEVVNVEKTKK